MKAFHKRQPSKASWGVCLILAAVFLVMLVFNLLTPLISDDYTYLMRYPTTEPIRSVTDVFVSQYHHYFLWGGRTVGLFLEQLLLFWGKGLFNLVNAAGFCLLVWAVTKLAVGQRAVTPLPLAVSLGLLVHANPCFGAVNLWVSGVASYLFPLLGAVCLLLPFRLELDRPWKAGRLAPVGMLFAGILAGWGNENTSGALVLAVLLFLVLIRVFQKKVPLWAITASAGALIGFLLLILAPGQWVRMDRASDDGRSLVTVLLTRIINATHSLWLYGSLLLVLFGALYLSLWVLPAKAKDRTLPLVYLILALAANYALILSPVYYIRSFYPVLAFLVMGILSCLSSLSSLSAHSSRLPQALLGGALCALLFFDLVNGGYDIASYSMMRHVREQEIRSLVQSGEQHIQTYAIFPYTRFCGAWGQPDLRRDPENWVNQNMAQHLGADSLTAVEQHYYPFPGYDDFSNTVESQMSFSLE